MTTTCDTSILNAVALFACAALIITLPSAAGRGQSNATEALLDLACDPLSSMIDELNAQNVSSALSFLTPNARLIVHTSRNSTSNIQGVTQLASLLQGIQKILNR